MSTTPGVPLGFIASGSGGGGGGAGPPGPQGPVGPAGPQGPQGPSNLTINTQTGTSYTLVLADVSVPTEIRCTNSSPVSVTVPPSSSVAAPIGCTFYIDQAGAGQVTLVAGAGVTLNTAVSLKTRTQFSFLGILCEATDVWLVYGDMG